MEQEPRYFWRRGFAFILDCLYMGILAFMISYPLTVILPNYFVILDAPINGYSCLPRQEPTDAFRKKIPTDFFKPDAKVNYRVCTIYAFFLESGTVGIAFSETESTNEDGNSSTFRKSYSSTIDKHGNPTPATDIFTLFFWTFLVFLIAYILMKNRGQTLAKEHLGLKLINDQKPTYSRYVKREFLKYLPTVILIANGLIVWIAALTNQESKVINFLASNLWIPIIIGIMTFAFGFSWYILPLIRWNGQMPYDRLTGFKVIKD
jgi:uncharacterized RDD family membrane protein YckC